MKKEQFVPWLPKGARHVVVHTMYICRGRLFVYEVHHASGRRTLRTAYVVGDAGLVVWDNENCVLREAPKPVRVMPRTYARVALSRKKV